MLEVREIYFRHKGEKRDILKGISFTAEKGFITAILGPNGSGKTTLFKCISGIWKNYKGEIKVDGITINKLSYKNRARYFSVVPQDHEPAFPFSVFDVVLMGRASYVGIFSSPGKKDYEKVETALELVGIRQLKDVPYTKISGGERQLVLIARAIAQEAPVMLLDEPTSHLDFKNQINVLKKIKEIAVFKKLTVVMTLHDPNLASFFSDKIVVINSGSKIAEGAPKEVLTEELIKKVYEVDVVKVNINNQNIICPLI